MSLYAVVKGDVVDGISIADAPLETDGIWICIDEITPQPQPGWSYNNGAFSPPPLPPPEPQIISKIAFRFRLTDLEYVGILQASKTDVAVEAWVATFNMVTQINLESPHTIAGAQLLVAKGLLTEARATEILGTPVSESEKP